MVLGPRLMICAPVTVTSLGVLAPRKPLVGVTMRPALTPRPTLTPRFRLTPRLMLALRLATARPLPPRALLRLRSRASEAAMTLGMKRAIASPRVMDLPRFDWRDDEDSKKRDVGDSEGNGNDGAGVCFPLAVATAVLLVLVALSFGTAELSSSAAPSDSSSNGGPAAVMVVVVVAAVGIAAASRGGSIPRRICILAAVAAYAAFRSRSSAAFSS